MIVDLSSPNGSSVNDGISPDEFTTEYIHVDHIIRMVSQHSQGALMAKFDVEAAYRNIPIHPSDHFLLGMRWRGKYYVHLALPFSLRSAPYLFNSVADIVEWILKHSQQVLDLLLYLYDFISVGTLNSPLCAQYLSIAQQVCHTLGLPLHPLKCVGPSSVMVVSSIELDSVAQIARLPTDKLEAACRIVQQWRSRKWCNRGQLESLIGHLQHAAKVVWPDRTFLRWMIDLLCCFRNRDHPIRLNHEFRLDLEWWHTLSSWNDVSFWLFPGLSPPADVEVISDTSGSLGFGAYLNGAWFSGSCADQQQSQSIAYKELFPVVLAARDRGAQWPRQHILFRCDNEAVVHILN